MAALAPGATAIWFSPRGPTVMIATPVACSSRRRTRLTSIPAADRALTARAPYPSAPTAPMMATSAPARAAATAWLAPLPPSCVAKRPLADRLSGLGQVVHTDDEVDVDRADDGHA